MTLNYIFALSELGVKSGVLIASGMQKPETLLRILLECGYGLSVSPKTLCVQDMQVLLHGFVPSLTVLSVGHLRSVP